MTETTPRLRWYEGDPGDIAALYATVDTSSACLFKILRPSSGYPDWALVTQLPGAQSEARYAEDGPEAVEKLKAEAERWLVECVASLGAVFPPEPARAATGKTRRDYEPSVTDECERRWHENCPPGTVCDCHCHYDSAGLEPPEAAAKTGEEQASA